MARGQIVGSLSLERANASFAYYTLYASVMDEQGNRYFKSVEEASNLENNVVFFLYGISREVNDINPLALSGSSSTDTPETFT